LREKKGRGPVKSGLGLQEHHTRKKFSSLENWGRRAKEGECPQKLKEVGTKKKPPGGGVNKRPPKLGTRKKSPPNGTRLKKRDLRPTNSRQSG